MDIKDYDKLTSAGENLARLILQLTTVAFASSQKTNSHTRKTPYVTALQPHARQRLIFVMVFYPSLLFSPFGTYLFTVALAWCGCSILVVKLSASSRLNLGQTENRKLSCVPQLVPRPHYYSARPERLGSCGPNEDPGKPRTRGRNQEQANMADKSVVFVRIQVYPSKGKCTIKKGA